MNRVKYSIAFFFVLLASAHTLAQTEDKYKTTFADQMKETPPPPNPDDNGSGGSPEDGEEIPPQNQTPDFEIETVEVNPTLVFNENVLIKSNRKIKRVRLFSINGKELISLEWPPEKEVFLDLNGVASGCYIVKTETTVNEYSEKIVLVR